MELNELLSKPLELHELPYDFSRGGKQYLKGYEACRERCRKSIEETGAIDGVYPIVNVSKRELSNDDRLYIDGYNELLMNAHRIVENKNVSRS